MVRRRANGKGIGVRCEILRCEVSREVAHAPRENGRRREKSGRPGGMPKVELGSDSISLMLNRV